MLTMSTGILSDYNNVEKSGGRILCNEVSYKDNSVLKERYRHCRVYSNHLESHCYNCESHFIYR